MASAPPYDPSIDYVALGYGPDMPDQNVMQGVPQADPTDLLSQIQPQAADPNAPQAAPAYPNAAQPQNILQQAAQPQAGQPGQFQPAQQLGQPAQYVPSPISPPRQRGSFLDMLGALGDRINRGMGAPTTSQLAQAHAQNLESADITNQTKLQDLAQTQTAAQQNAIPVLNGFANSLLKIKNAGGNLDVSGPVLADQLGIPQAQAQKLLALEKAQPGALQNFADATAQVAASKGGGEKFANEPLYTRDSAGNYILHQLGNQGTLGTPALPPGEKIVLPVTYHDQGTQYSGTDKFGAPAGAPIPKSGNPEPGTGNPDVPTKPYVPIGPKSQDEHEKFIQAQKDARDKANATEQARLGLVKNTYNTMDDMISGLTKLRDDPALGQATGSLGAIEKHIPNSPAQGVLQRIATLQAGQIKTTLDAFRAGSADGKLGFRPSQAEILRAADISAALSKTDASKADYQRAINDGIQFFRTQQARLKASNAQVFSQPASSPVVIKFDAQGRRIQ